MSGPRAHFRVDAAAAADAHRTLAPASALVSIDHPREVVVGRRRIWLGSRLIARVGTPAEIDREIQSLPVEITRVHRPDAVLIPGLVNAHTHLDLTHMGPRPDLAGDFPRFVDAVRAGRRTDPRDIAASVARGVELSLASGVVAVGDIAGAALGRPTQAAAHALAGMGFAGVSFIEFFAIGLGEARGLTLADAALHAARSEGTPLRVSLQPHAPYSASPRAYEHAVERAAALGIPISTHLAESPAEREFIVSAAGPQRDLLQTLGVWDDALLRVVGQGRSPVEHLAPVLEFARSRGVTVLAAHVNDASDADLDFLARHRAAVAYCPRASEYFRAAEHFGPHRYRDMLAAGVRVVLGTDSIINLPPHAADPHAGSFGPLDEMRRLRQRDGTDARTLLRMATTESADILGMNPARFAFDQSGRAAEIAGLVSVQVRAMDGESELNPVEALLASSEPPELLFAANSYGDVGIGDAI